MMYKTNSNPINSIKYLLIIPVTMVLFLVFSCQQPENTTESIQKSTSIVKENLENEIFKVVEEMPRFPGCEAEVNDSIREACSKTKMLQYIYGNIKYPEVARKKGTSGQVIAQFVVNTAGDIEDIKIVRDIGDGCGETVLKTIESMNNMAEKWIPGKQSGQKVKVMYTLPVKFKLEDK